MTEWPIPLPTDTIDALVYAGNWPHWPVAGAGEAALLERMDRLSMRAAVLLSLTTVYGDALAGNDDLAGLVKRHPGRLVGCVTYDPRRNLPPEEVMTRGWDAGLCGLALFPMHHGYNLGDIAQVENALALAADWDWPVVVPVRLVMDWSLPSTPIEAVVRAARHHPHVRFLVAGTHYGEMDYLLSAMEDLPNLYGETSCNQGAGALAEMMARGDPARILFGTGQPVQMPECNLVKLLADQLDDRDREMVSRTNAAQFFKV